MFANLNLENESSDRDKDSFFDYEEVKKAPLINIDRTSSNSSVVMPFNYDWSKPFGQKVETPTPEKILIPKGVFSFPLAPQIKVDKQLNEEAKDSIWHISDKGSEISNDDPDDELTLDRTQSVNSTVSRWRQ